MTVLGVEAIYKCIYQHFKLSEMEFLEFIGESTLVNIRMRKNSISKLNSRLVHAVIFVYDDDRDIYAEITSSNSGVLAEAYNSFAATTPARIVEELSRPGYLFLELGDNPTAQVLKNAAENARKVFADHGYKEAS